MYPITRLTRTNWGYPERLRAWFDERASVTVTAIGSLDILHRRMLALFCSARCPGRLIVQAHDLAHALRDRDVATIGGFHSPVEQECLRVLLRGKQPIVVCPARGVEEMRIPSEWRTAIAGGRLLVLSPFEAKVRRPTAELAQERNAFVAALADAILVVHAAPGGATERFCREIASTGKPFFTLEDSGNGGLVALGAQPVRPEGAAGMFEQAVERSSSN